MKNALQMEDAVGKVKLQMVAIVMLKTVDIAAAKEQFATGMQQERSAPDSI